MRLEDFFHKADKNFFDFNSKSDYVSGLFKKAGITKAYSRDYLRHLYLGIFPFSADCRACFPDKIEESAIASFFEKHVQKEKKVNLYDSFGLMNMEIDSACFFIALARQFIEIVKAPEEREADDIVAFEYMRMMNNPDQKKSLPPLYKNDSVLCANVEPIKLHDVYAVYRHTWRIRNVGTVDWNERKLVFINSDKSHVRADKNEIMIPRLKPRERTEVYMEFQCRGFEGRFVSHWVMLDKDGKDCFPCSSWFDVEFNVVFCI